MKKQLSAAGARAGATLRRPEVMKLMREMSVWLEPAGNGKLNINFETPSEVEKLRQRMLAILSKEK